MLVGGFIALWLTAAETLRDDRGRLRYEFNKCDVWRAEQTTQSA